MVFGDRGGGKEEGKGSRGERGVDGLKCDVGPAGKQGERGPSGIEELCAWLPAFILHEFRNTESGSYFFPTDGSGFKKTGDVINTLISHSTHPIMLEKPVDAIAVKGSSTTIPIPNRTDRLALQFTDKMLYKASGLKLSLPNHAWVCLCVTFRVRAVYDQWIVSSPPAEGNQQFRGVSATPTGIRVWGKEHGGAPFYMCHILKDLG